MPHANISFTIGYSFDCSFCVIVVDPRNKHYRQIIKYDNLWFCIDFGIIVPIDNLCYSGNVIDVLIIAVMVTDDHMVLDIMVLQRLKEPYSPSIKSIEIDVLSLIKYVTQIDNSVDLILNQIWDKLIRKKISTIFDEH
jgi:hypothetical protein